MAVDFDIELELVKDARDFKCVSGRTRVVTMQVPISRCDDRSSHCSFQCLRLEGREFSI